MTTSPTSVSAAPVAATAFGVVTPPDQGTTLGDGVLGRWQRRNRERTIPHGLEQLEAVGNLDNFRSAAGLSNAPFRGLVFADSDVYKTLEAIAWELGHGGDPALRAFYDDTVALLDKAQEEGGYLNTAYQLADEGGAPRRDHATVRERWTDFAFGHELYCAGHLIQAAVASARSLGDDRLLEVATRFADLIVREFGGPESPVYPGHPEVEYALVELYRLTGKREYLDTAAAFIDRRGAGCLGDGAFGKAYYQDDASVRETEVMRGHAVRAIYLNSGAADVYLETGDATLLAALETQWDDMLSRRSYVTGGTGSRHRDEAFGDAYELPSDRAYAETCAGIAAMHWAWRMYLATGGAKYADFFETALYNVVADGLAESGDAFFYSNPLQLRADHLSVQEETAAATRLSWYNCACCPPNLMRTFASMEGYLAGVRGNELQLVQYTRSRIEAEVGGTRCVLDVDTDYPVEGRVRISVTEGFGAADAEHIGALSLRVPRWCGGASVVVNGAADVEPNDAEPTNAEPNDAEPTHAEPNDGWIRLDNALAAGTVVEIDFDLTPHVLVPDERIDAIRGCVAVQRGPIVYCLEQRDNEADVDRATIDPEEPLAETDATTELGPMLKAAGAVREGGTRRLYARREVTRPSSERTILRLRPYATWGNGDPGAMRIWIPTK
ncbi:glycoside hydrolase family 127 protein [Sinomonas terrae]|uniref:Glycoside hydrolase family 127 protein n=1 Tax=Sinomonas terrae TaxID=2908838 RepID=A0ABS9U4J9_9MICC|nr:beta-L-arabinofuranosidase domain-containing protein [Sinomonas terrae]MCH6471327.1 glycoside hydrolase family 127 protein [Sinomonas terrae]